jgi:hypothetical protein
MSRIRRSSRSVGVQVLSARVFEYGAFSSCLPPTRSPLALMLHSHLCLRTHRPPQKRLSYRPLAMGGPSQRPRTCSNLCVIYSLPRRFLSASFIVLSCLTPSFSLNPERPFRSAKPPFKPRASFYSTPVLLFHYLRSFHSLPSTIVNSYFHSTSPESF